MGFDVVGAINSVWQSQYGVLAVLLTLLLFTLWSSGFFGRLLKIIEEMLFNNWQLALLGSTAIALSLASGYTTFDGLRNFTSAPLLSVLIAFGIQGVMLIVAWLIGESFATGMNQRVAGGRGFTAKEAVIGMALGIALIGLAFYWTLNQYSAVGFTRTASLVEGFRTDWVRFADVALYFLLALALVAVIAFNFRRGGDISVPYVQSVRVIAKNAVLWVMFLASMGASVFFSFDSHFNAIFPAEQRKRAAEIRTLNQVGRVVADIGERTQKAQLAEAEHLFETDGWKAYDTQLSKLAHESQSAQGEIEKYFVQKIEDRRRGIIEQQERIAGSERNQTALLRKRDELEAELQRIEPGVGALEAELAKAQATYNETKQTMAAKRIDASAEDGGVEGTLKRGKGPVYRQRMTEIEELQRKLAITDEPRLKEAQKRRDQASARIVSLKRELATINGDVAKYKGEAQTADQRIKAAESVDHAADGPKVDPARVLPAFERARAAFRQRPDTEHLAAVQAQCGNLLTAMTSAPATKDRIRAIDCDPKQAAEAAGRVFALNAGLVAFRDNCAGGSKLPENATTDTLLGFGRKCLQDSGLVSKDADDLGKRMQAIDMNRDDKAHRFVVTWNAFLDGNRLAYLALVLAIGVDALVFMAGLFGAAAVKSPLSDVPSFKARSAHQLESIVEAALLPKPFEKARIALHAMRPIEQRDVVLARGRGSSFTHEVRLYQLDPETAAAVRDVLNAGASIGAVSTGSKTGHYLVRAELYEFLCDLIKRKLKSEPDEARRGLELHDLETRLTEALMPDVGTTADTVLQHLHPIDEKNGFSAELFIGEVEPQNLRPVRNVLTAGSSLRVVQRDRKDLDRYYIHSDLYKTLARLRARELMSSSNHALQAEYRGQLREPVADRAQLEFKGANGLQAPRIASPHERRSISLNERTHQSDDQSAPDGAAPEHIFAALSGALDVTGEFLQDLVAISHIEVSREIAKALDALCEQEALFRQKIEPLLQEKRSGLEAARKKLVAALDVDDWSTAERITGYLRDVVHLLIFSEDGAYEWALSEIIEAAKLPVNRVLITAHQDDWIGGVQEHYDIMQRQPRRDMQDWKRVVRQLEDVTEKLFGARIAEGQPSLPKHMLS